MAVLELLVFLAHLEQLARLALQVLTALWDALVIKASWDRKDGKDRKAILALLVIRASVRPLAGRATKATRAQKAESA